MSERFTTDARAVVTAAVTEAERRSRWRRSHRPFTGGAKLTLEQALRDALALAHRWMGTEHVRLAPCARSEPDPAVCLRSALALDQVAMRTDLERRLAAAT